MSDSIFNTIKPLTSLGIDSLTGLPSGDGIYASSNYGGFTQNLAPRNSDPLKITDDVLSPTKASTGFNDIVSKDAVFPKVIGTNTSDSGLVSNSINQQTSSLKTEISKGFSTPAIVEQIVSAKTVNSTFTPSVSFAAPTIGEQTVSAKTVNSTFIPSESLAALAAPARKTISIDDLTFSTSGQSIWGNGPAFTFKDNRFLGGSWNSSGSKTLINEKKAPKWLGGFTIVPEVGISGSTSGKAGLQSNLTIQGGTTNARLPIDIWIDLPSQIKAGDTVTIKSGFTVDPKATFSTLSPNAQYNLDLILGLNAKAGFKVGGSNKDLVNISVPEKQINLLKLNGQNISTTVDIPGGYGSFGLKVPNLNTTGTLGSDKKTLSSSKTDSFLNGNIDLDKIATSVLQKVGVPVPPFSGSVSASLAGFGGSFSYTLADFQLLAQLNLKQKFDLVANSLKGNLTLSNGAKTKLDFTIGQDLTFKAPTDIVGGKLDLSASVNLGANLKNTTTLGGNSSINISALAGSISGSIAGINLGSEGFGPLYQKNVPIIGGDIATVYNNQFALGGFNAQTFNAGSIAVV